MEKITQLLFCEVVTQDGERLGRLFEVRSYGEPEHGITHQGRTIDELLCGTRGLLELIGFRKPCLQSVPWHSVIGIKEGKIIVDRDYKTIGMIASEDKRAIEQREAQRSETEATSGS